MCCAVRWRPEWGERKVRLKPAPTAPFRLSVRQTNSHGNGRESPGDGVPGSHLSLRRAPEARGDAPSAKRRDESAPPTKPSIAPPSNSPIRDTRHSALGDVSPLAELERTTPTLTYSLVLALSGAALGLGTLVAAWCGGRPGMTWLTGTLWSLAAGTLFFSSGMAALITLSFTRRLGVLAEVASRLVPPSAEPGAETPRGDVITSLARSIMHMSERMKALLSELERCVEEEQARVDELVRERTRELARESEDLQRVLGESKGLLSFGRDGRVLGQSTAILGWLGSAPRAAKLWDYFEQAAHGAGQRFEAGWGQVLEKLPGEPDFARMPKSLALGDRYLAMDYKAVLGPSGKLERVLLVVSDITIPDPDPATPGQL